MMPSFLKSVQIVVSCSVLLLMNTAPTKATSKDCCHDDEGNAPVSSKISVHGHCFWYFCISKCLNLSLKNNNLTTFYGLHITHTNIFFATNQLFSDAVVGVCWGSVNQPSYVASPDVECNYSKHNKPLDTDGLVGFVMKHDRQAWRGQRKARFSGTVGPWLAAHSPW